MITMTFRCAVLLMVLLAKTPIQAVLLTPLSIDALTSQAQLVVQGRVLSKTCQRDPAGRIYTKIEFQVADVWKGAVTANPFTIVHGGGVLGEEQAVVSGQVEYEIGEEVVAFLVVNERGQGVTLGLAQGKFHVWEDPVSGIKFAKSPFHGGADQPNPKNRKADASRGTGVLKLAEFKQHVVGTRQ